MAKYKVRKTQEIRTTYVVDASSATAAVNKVKNQKNIPNIHHTLEQHFMTEEIEEDNQNKHKKAGPQEDDQLKLKDALPKHMDKERLHSLVEGSTSQDE